MSIEPIKGRRGEEQALCKCSDCCAEITVAAAHGHCKGGQKFIKMTLAKPVQVIEKIKTDGWVIVKNKLRCPRCEAARKETHTPPQEPKMANKVTELRKPTPAQKRQIVEMLMLAYDTEAGRYRGGDTDKTVAEAIGGGVMLGWVAEIREDMFGPAGGNDELEKLEQEIAEWSRDFEKRTHEEREAAEAANERIREKHAEFQKRIDAIKKAVGPKAASA